MTEPSKTDREPTKPRGLGWIGILFVLFWSGLVLLFDIKLGSDALRQVKAQSYPTTIGTITHSEVAVQRGARTAHHVPDVSYTYAVADRQYTGTHYRYGDLAGGNAIASQIVAGLPVGKQATVHYAPDDPADAVLHVGLDGMDFFLAMFLTPFNIVTLLMWGGAVMALLNWWRPPPLRFGKVWDDGFQTRVRIGGIQPLLAGLIAALAVSFLAIFLVGIPFGANPPLPMMYAVWGLTLGIAVLACIWQYLRLAAGRSDLVVDDANRLVRLPRTFGRKGPVELSQGSVRDVEVASFEKWRSKGRCYSVYAPTLVVVERHGPQRRERLAEWTDRAEAEQLAAWLRERLKIKPANSASLESRT